MKWNCAIYIDVDGRKDCHTEWSKSERETQIYINTDMWNLEKWYRWSYLQSRNRDINVENKCMDTEGERGSVGWIGSLGLTYIHSWCCCPASQSCPTPCNPIDCSTSGLLIPHCIPEFAQVHVYTLVIDTVSKIDNEREHTV